MSVTLKRVDGQWQVNGLSWPTLKMAFQAIAALTDRL